MRFLVLLLLTAISLPSAIAQDGKKPALIKQFLVVTDARGTLEKLRIDNVVQTRNLLFQQAGEQAKNPLMKRLLDRAMAKYTDYSREIFDWPKWETKYVALYGELFTESELEGIIAFYETPSGRAMIRAQPEIGKRIQQQMFARNGEANARIDSIMKETVAEIQEEVRKEGANQTSQPTPPSQGG